MNDNFAAIDLAQGDQPAQLGGERLVVGEKEDALPGSRTGVADGKFEGMPGLAGAGAAVNEELAVFRKLVEQREAGEELPLEELFGVIDEGAFFLWQ